MIGQRVRAAEPERWLRVSGEGEGEGEREGKGEDWRIMIGQHVRAAEPGRGLVVRALVVSKARRFDRVVQEFASAIGRDRDRALGER